jgi:hypothetical protein
VAGSLAQRVTYGGHAWVFLQYLLGFRQLGFDVLFLDRLSTGMLDGERSRPGTRTAPQIQSLVEVMRRFNLGNSFAVLGDSGDVIAGLPRGEALRRVRGSLFLLNVMGFLDDSEILAAAPKRVFLDIDPGFGQMWRELGLADVFAGHDVFVTIAENIGRPGCLIPTCGLDWITTRQPIVLGEWPVQTRQSGGFAAIGAWRGPFAPIEYNGKTFGLRVHEFRKFAQLPRRTDLEFEAAIDIHDADDHDVALLAENGWRLVDPTPRTGDPWAYRRYVQGARAEFMVAKNMYVETRSGWFSDRSVCFLASGRPVLAQDTAFSANGGDGLVTFRTLDEAVAGARSIEADYTRHSDAARSLAEDLFASDSVLMALLTDLGAG